MQLVHVHAIQLNRRHFSKIAIALQKYFFVLQYTILLQPLSIFFLFKQTMDLIQISKDTSNRLLILFCPSFSLSLSLFHTVGVGISGAE